MSNFLDETGLKKALEVVNNKKATVEHGVVTIQSARNGDQPITFDFSGAKYLKINLLILGTTSLDSLDIMVHNEDESVSEELFYYETVDMELNRIEIEMFSPGVFFTTTYWGDGAIETRDVRAYDSTQITFNLIEEASSGSILAHYRLEY